MLDLTKLHQLNNLASIAITKHGKDRLVERSISVDDIIKCINTEKIIKQYEDDKPLPSCLISGKSVNDKALHVVVSNDENYIYLITAYYPNPELWNEEFDERKEH